MGLSLNFSNYDDLYPLCVMEFPVLIILTNPFRIYGLLGGKFQFHSHFNSIFCKHTVQNLLRRHVLRRLICSQFEIFRT